MDPISAFSLACNVVQAVDFGFKLAARCREFYASGSFESNDLIELVAIDLLRISEDIENVAATSPGSDRELTDLQQHRENCCRFWKTSSLRIEKASEVFWERLSVPRGRKVPLMIFKSNSSLTGRRSKPDC